MQYWPASEQIASAQTKTNVTPYMIHYFVINGTNQWQISMWVLSGKKSVTPFSDKCWGLPTRKQQNLFYELAGFCNLWWILYAKQPISCKPHLCSFSEWASCRLEKTAAVHNNIVAIDTNNARSSILDILQKNLQTSTRLNTYVLDWGSYKNTV